MVIESRAIGENDRRVVLLTRQMGKISAFARNSRRPNSSLLAATGLFCYGTFRLYAGRDSYTLTDAKIDQYFPYFRNHFEQACIASYFMEVLSYITRENNDEASLLLLAYASLKALETERLPMRLVRAAFEIKSVAIEGEFAGLPHPKAYLPATIRAVEHIVSAPIAGLYTFSLDKEPLEELCALGTKYIRKAYEHQFASLAVLEAMGL